MINILHISDIHFKTNECPEEKEYRKEILNKFVSHICLLEDEYRPNVVLVTGDIANHATKEEYQLALEWFSGFSSLTGIPHSQFFFCPGNHDVNREARTIGGALKIRDSANTSDNDFSNWQYKFHPLFESYTEFCDNFGCPPYKYGRKNNPSFIVGGRTTAKKTVNILCVNSSWYHFDTEASVKGNLWLGLPLLREMNGRQLPVESEYDKGAINLALCHHTKDWLHRDETIKYTSETGSREVTWDYLSNRIHLIFHGHIEAENIFRPSPQGKRGYVIIAGALYYKPNHNHSFNIIRLNVEERCFEYYAYEYKNGNWSCVPNDDDNDYSLIANRKTVIPTTPCIFYPEINVNLNIIPSTIYKNVNVVVRFFENNVDEGEMFFETKIIIAENSDSIEIVNDDDLLRPLKLHISFNKNADGNHKFNISLPENKYGSVEATLFREKLLTFISYGCKHEIRYNGAVYMSGTINSNENYRTAQFEMDLLTELFTIEKYYNKNIDLPEELFEQDGKSLKSLLEIKENGCIHRPIGIEIHFSTTNKAFKDFIIKYNIKHCFYGIVQGEYAFRIGNTSIPVGDRTLIFTNMQIVDIERVIQKSKILDDDDVLSMKAKTNTEGEMIIIYEKYTDVTVEDIAKENIVFSIDCIINYDF